MAWKGRGKTLNSEYTLAFMGTPDFAAVPLENLIKAGYNIAFAVTMPDKARGRGKKLSPSPVKLVAQAHGIPVLQPEAKEDFFHIMSELQKFKVDLVVVAAYGYILPEEMLTIPPRGFVNIHASLLPRHRGASPIQSAIMAGDEETGVSLMHMTKDMDAGDILAAARTPVDSKTSGDLFEELAALGSKLLIDILPDILSGEAAAVPQDSELVTYSYKIKKDDSIIDFARPAEYIARMVRAMNPSPGARTYLGEQLLIITKARALGAESNSDRGTAATQPGLVEQVDDSGITVMAGQGKLLITELKPAGKQNMKVADYIRGNKIEIGHILG